MGKLGYTWYPKFWSDNNIIFSLSLEQRGLYREIIDKAMMSNNRVDVNIAVWERWYNCDHISELIQSLVDIRLIKHNDGIISLSGYDYFSPKNKERSRVIGYTWWVKDWSYSDRVFSLSLEEKAVYRELIDRAMCNDNKVDVAYSTWRRMWNCDNIEIILSKLSQLRFIDYRDGVICLPECEPRIAKIRAGKMGGAVSKRGKSNKSKNHESNDFWKKIIKDYKDGKMYQDHEWGTVKRNLRKALERVCEDSFVLEDLSLQTDFSEAEILSIFCENWYNDGRGKPRGSHTYDAMAKYFMKWKGAIYGEQEKRRSKNLMDSVGLLYAFWIAETNTGVQFDELTEDGRWELVRKYQEIGEPHGRYLTCLLKSMINDGKGMGKTFLEVLQDYTFWRLKYIKWIGEPYGRKHPVKPYRYYDPKIES